jgi:acetyl-CoA acetyltransferase
VSIEAAITGLGITELGRTGSVAAVDHAIEACRLAVQDAGLARADVDGLLVAHSPLADCESLGLRLQGQLGLGKLAVLQDVHAEGSSVMQLVHNASLYVSAGIANHVLCVFADAPLVAAESAGQAYFVAVPLGHVPGWEAAHGLFGAAAAYGLAARRHMIRFGTTTEHFGAVAVAARAWAAGNPRAAVREPLTLAEHQSSPWVAEPFRRLDCAFPVNGGAAVLVSAGSNAAECRRAPVRVAGVGQAHAARSLEAGGELETHTPAGVAAARALRMADVTVGDIDVCELYDCFSYTTIVLLEDLGFCPKGEGGRFVMEGHIAPGGTIPTNTGGGQLSGYYLQGMTPLTEAVIQLRGDGGDRQVAGARTALVHNHGGVLEHHACAVLTTDRIAP